MYRSFFSRINLIVVFFHFKRCNKSWPLLVQRDEIQPSFALFDYLSWNVKTHANRLFFHIVKIRLIVPIPDLRDVSERIEDISFLLFIHAFAIVIHD